VSLLDTDSHELLDWQHAGAKRHWLMCAKDNLRSKYPPKKMPVSA
jgi:hypothetical protein